MSDSANDPKQTAKAAVNPRMQDFELDLNLDSLDRLEAGGPMKVVEWSALPDAVRHWSYMLAMVCAGVLIFIAIQHFGVFE
ncbi:hypothetical protein FHS18_004306 [Paenibacillus phyllosphaerae]|uniref:Uncharacterized protein n=1 Tax=Paenibacillus phyllosphaerae TaxID=274593 RepID=A0A7W5B0L6_9BACL|nr:hypothetical protein [Paenibacillus phyllosphaerae]MBB3112220.1 hypothetical protein [Paenibacillus phyllosphaerae]